jgi:hypothetical protein
MKIQWKEFTIVVNEWSWDLYKGRKHLGFFSKLDTLVDTMIRRHYCDKSDVMDIEEFMRRWEDVISGFIKRIDE